MGKIINDLAVKEFVNIYVTYVNDMTNARLLHWSVLIKLRHSRKPSAGIAVKHPC